MHLSKNRKSVTYSIDNIKNLKNIILIHFEKYPLLSQKGADFQFFFYK